MSSLPPEFVLEASEVLRISPEVLRLSKRNDPTIDARSYRLLRQRCTEITSGCKDMAFELPIEKCKPRELLLHICRGMILRDLWRKEAIKTYLQSLRMISDGYVVGVPTSSSNMAVYSDIVNKAELLHESHDVSTTISGTTDALEVDEESLSEEELHRLTATFHRILNKANKLDQLQTTQRRLLEKIYKNDFIKAMNSKRLESILYLGLQNNLSNKKDNSSVSFQQKILFLEQARDKLSKSEHNLHHFIKWVDSGEATPTPACKYLNSSISSGVDVKASEEESNDIVSSLYEFRYELGTSIQDIADAHEYMRRALSTNESAAHLASQLDSILRTTYEILKKNGLFEIGLACADSNDTEKIDTSSLVMAQFLRELPDPLSSSDATALRSARVAVEKIDAMIEQCSPYSCKDISRRRGGHIRK